MLDVRYADSEVLAIPESIWARTRALFRLPVRQDGTTAHYLCGNGLGPQPRAVAGYIERELDEWARRGFGGYFDAQTPWIEADTAVTEAVARIVGARAHEVAVMGTLTGNLHVLMSSLFRPAGARRRIVMEHRAFSSDRYAAVAQLERAGLGAGDLIELPPRPGEHHVRDEDIIDHLARDADRTALVLLGGVNHHTGQAFDLARIARAAHDAGALFAVDLAHAIGNIPLALHDWNVDFAVWCHYKYLNADPGGVAGCFVHERHLSRADRSALPGWWGAAPAARFGFQPEFAPAPGAACYRQSSPPVLAIASLRAAIDAFRSVPQDQLFRRGAALADQLARAAADVPGCRVITPGRHGAQISLTVPRPANELVAALKARGVLCTSRGAEVLRVAAAPLYNDEDDVRAFGAALEEALS